jgi:hypothetical protein
MRGLSISRGAFMDRQSEAYRGMTPDDVVESIPDSTIHPPIDSLDELYLPREYAPIEGTPKTLAQAESNLFERIMDPTAPDDNSTKGVYVRMRFEAKE